MVTVNGKIDENGQLIIELPPNAPQGDVEVTIKKRVPYVEPQLTPEEEAALDGELKELLSPENLHGQGLTAAEIAESPEIGILGLDFPDGQTYVENLRRSRRERRKW
jgi:hypothetical protein